MWLTSSFSKCSYSHPGIICFPLVVPAKRTGLQIDIPLKSHHLPCLGKECFSSTPPAPGSSLTHAAHDLREQRCFLRIWTLIRANHSLISLLDYISEPVGRQFSRRGLATMPQLRMWSKRWPNYIRHNTKWLKHTQIHTDAYTHTQSSMRVSAWNYPTNFLALGTT